MNTPALAYIIILAQLIQINQALIGFECGTTNPTVKTYSLLDTGTCDIHQDNIKTTNATIELLQTADIRTTHVIQCKIEITRTIYHCGMFSHLGATANAIQQHLYDINYEQCKSIHQTGIFKYDNTHTITGLKINSTRSTGVDLAGKVEDTTCSGAAYADEYGSWSNVFVQGLIKITLLEQYATINQNEDRIKLNSGTTCKYSEQHCIDMDAGHSFWSNLANLETCLQTKYDTLYIGNVIKTEAPDMETVYTINTSKAAFSLAIKGTVELCNRILTRTEHPRLFIYEKTSKNTLFTNDIRPKTDILNINIFEYVDSKFIHVTRHLGNQMKNLYLNIIQQKCETERNTISNLLSIAITNPDEFAYNIMKGPGFIARLAGEVIHVAKCTPQEVNILHTDKCYEHLPVTTGNKTRFLTPKTHILKEEGTVIDCDRIIPHMYKIQNQWITLSPRPKITDIKILTLKPNTTTNWTPDKIDMTAGIYSQQDLQKFQQHLLFPLEKNSIIENIVRTTQGQNTNQEGIFEKLLTENSLTHIAENTWNKFVRKFTHFGSISAGIIMVILLFQMIKSIIDTIIRGYTLHTIYGWSIHILGALFSSITALLIALNRTHHRKKEENNKQEIELQEIIIHPKRPEQQPEQKTISIFNTQHR